MINWKDLIINYAKRTPYVHIGDYMARWWIVPYRHECALKWYQHPVGWLLQQFDVAIRVHEILRSDSAVAWHTHPWFYITCILKSGYIECTPQYNEYGKCIGEKKTIYKTGDILFRTASSRHRLELFDVKQWIEHEHQVCTTLFITFKKTNEWGFYKKDGKFIPHKKYLENGRQ